MTVHNEPRATVSATAIRKMIYMPPRAARRLRQMAFDDECKENDIFIKAIRRYFEARGIKDADLWAMKPILKKGND